MNNEAVGKSFYLAIVSAEAQIFSGLVKQLFVSGEMGDLEILYGHAPLLTSLRPGPTWIVNQQGEEEVFYISGGMLEVQPDISTILADTALRANDIDESQALEAKIRAEKILSGQTKDFDYAKAQAQLTRALAQLKVLRKFRERDG
ncbi:MAG: F0F1 ATP synthase subunit epsilon [Gammaproteobacteria bacterium]|nr:F0F1 ATP synthase subunit epsilon [Gammaproteobacteria bacterium]MBP9728744.1 F0F1 ATP synthase subunit epsilon [Gammaproteobacteria bacterium]